MKCEQKTVINYKTEKTTKTSNAFNLLLTTFII